MRGSRTKGQPEAREEEWLIWSYEHDAWWRANHAGYTADYYEAGTYTEQQADAILAGANWNGQLNEAKVPRGLIHEAFSVYLSYISHEAQRAGMEVAWPSLKWMVAGGKKGEGEP